MTRYGCFLDHKSHLQLTFSLFLQFCRAEGDLVRVASELEDGKNWGHWLWHRTSIWEDWTRTDRDRVTSAIKALTGELEKVEDKQEKNQILVSFLSVWYPVL